MKLLALAALVLVVVRLALTPRPRRDDASLKRAFERAHGDDR